MARFPLWQQVNVQLYFFRNSGSPLATSRQLRSWRVTYLSHLVSACMRFFCRKVNQFALTFYFFKVRNPDGRQTPQDSLHSTPNHRRIEEIEDLLAQATLSIGFKGPGKFDQSTHWILAKIRCRSCSAMAATVCSRQSPSSLRMK